MREILQFNIEQNIESHVLFQEIILNDKKRAHLAFFIKMLNRDEGGSPVVENLQINNIQINTDKMGGFVEIGCTIAYHWACAGKELVESLISKFDFSIDKENSTLKVIGPETGDRDMNGF